MKVCCATGFSLRPRNKQACNQATTIVGIWQQITEMIILCGNNKVRLSSLNEELIRKKVFPLLGEKSTESSLQDSAIVTTSRRPQARVVESFFEHVFAQGSVKNKHNQSQKGFIIMTIILP